MKLRKRNEHEQFSIPYAFAFPSITYLSLFSLCFLCVFVILTITGFTMEFSEVEYCFYGCLFEIHYNVKVPAWLLGLLDRLMHLVSSESIKIQGLFNVITG